MKNFMLLSFFLFFSAAITAQSALAVNYSTSAAIEWDITSHDFGSITKDIPVSTEFIITNNGSSALVLTDVKAGCGCTATAFSQEPIAPGGSESITVTYNAKKVGAFSKTVSVFTNQTEAPYTLKIAGEVKE